MEEITSQAPTTEEDIDPMVEITTEFPNYLVDYEVRNRSRFFVQVRHETTLLRIYRIVASFNACY